MSGRAWALCGCSIAVPVEHPWSTGRVPMRVPVAHPLRTTVVPVSTLEVPIRLPVVNPVSTAFKYPRVPRTASTHLGAELLRQRARHAVLDRGGRAERQPQRAAAAVRLAHLRTRPTNGSAESINDGACARVDCPNMRSPRVPVQHPYSALEQLPSARTAAGRRPFAWRISTCREIPRHVCAVTRGAF